MKTELESLKTLILDTEALVLDMEKFTNNEQSLEMKGKALDTLARAAIAKLNVIKDEAYQLRKVA